MLERSNPDWHPLRQTSPRKSVPGSGQGRSNYLPGGSMDIAEPPSETVQFGR